MSAGESIKQWRRGRYKLVDVRPSGSYLQFRIPESLNVPLYALKTKTFLKTESIVLLDEGRRRDALEQACAELKQAGFKQVKVLRGGLHAWREHGGPLDGDVLAQRSLTRMPPAEFLSEAKYKDWLILYIGKEKKDELRRFLPQAVSLGPLASGERFNQALRGAVAVKKRTVAAPNVLLVNETGMHYEKIETAIRRAALKNVFYLEGGLSGYGKHVRDHVAMLNHVENPPKRKACGA